MLETSSSERHNALTRMIQEMSQKLGTPQSRSNWEKNGFGYKHGTGDAGNEEKGRGKREAVKESAHDGSPPGAEAKGNLLCGHDDGHKSGYGPLHSVTTE